MDSEMRLIRAVERVAAALEKIAGIEPPAKRPVTVAPTTVRRETYTNDGLTQGGTPPEQHFARHPHERD